MHTVGIECRTFAKAFFGYREHSAALGRASGSDYIVSFTQTDAPHADSRTPHRAGFRLGEAGRHPVMGSDENGVLSRCRENGNQLISLVKGNSSDSVCTDILQGGLFHTLYRAVLCDKDKVLVLFKTTACNHGTDLFPGFSGFYRKNIDNIGAAGCATCRGNGIAFFDIHPAGIHKEENVVMSRGRKDRLHKVLFLGCHRANSSAAAALCLVFRQCEAFDVSAVRQGEDGKLFLNQIFILQIFYHILNLCPSCIAEFVANGNQLFFQDSLDLFRICKKVFIITDFLFQFFVFRLDFFPVETLQLDQAHIADILSLTVVKPKAFHQALLCIIIAGADDMDNLINIILCYEKRFQQMSPLLRLTQIISGTADYQILLEGEILVEDMAERQNFRLRLVVDKRKHIDGKAGLQLRLSKEAVKHDLRIGIALKLDNDTHAVAVRLIPEVGDPFQALFMYLIRNILYQLTFIDLIRQLRDNNTRPFLFAVFFKLRPCADDDFSSAGRISLPDAGTAHNDPPRRKIRPLEMLHQITEGRFRIVQHADAGIDHFRKVMGRNIRRHTDSNSAGTVDQKIRET